MDSHSEETGEFHFCPLTSINNCPLHYYTSKNEPRKLLEYLKNGEDVNSLYKGHTPLHVAVEYEAYDAVDILIQHNCDINATDLDSVKTAFLFAACSGKTDMVRMLANHGADVNMADEECNSPFYCACNHGHRDTVICMLNLGGVDINQRGDRTPLIGSAISGQSEIVQMLLQAGCEVDLTDSSGCTALYHAVLKGDRVIVQLLMAAGANPNIGMKSGEYPVHVAALHGNTAILDALISAGCDVNVPMNVGPPINLAVVRQHINAVRKLIKAGAQLDCHCEAQLTTAPLSEAVHDFSPCLAIIIALIQGGCNVDISCHSYNKTAIEQALMKSHIDVAKLLLAADCRPPRPDVLEDILEFHETDESTAIRQLLVEHNLVKSLRRLCRIAIRRSLGYGHRYEARIEQLSLPSPLKYFLQFPELNDFVVVTTKSSNRDHHIDKH